MSRVVVTGAAGFIGSHLVSRLAAEGHEVTAVVRRPQQATGVVRPGVKACVADVTDGASLAAAMCGADVVYHLAGRICARSLADFRAVNSAGVARVAEAAAARHAPPRLVVVSSLAAAGPSPAGRPRTEADPPAPISYYGLSKLEGEAAAHRWAGRLPVSIVRPPFVFGGGDRTSLPLFRMIRRWGAQVVLRGHDLELSLLHVDDFVQSLLLVAAQGRRIEPTPIEQTGNGRAALPCSVGIYSPSDPNVVTYSLMGQMIGAQVGRTVRLWRPPRALFWTVCAINAAQACVTGRLGVLNFDKLREARATAWTCSNDRSYEELGFSPSAPLGERLAETLSWYERSGWL